jgi:hypothetical protein
MRLISEWLTNELTYALIVHSTKEKSPFLKKKAECILKINVLYKCVMKKTEAQKCEKRKKVTRL